MPKMVQDTKRIKQKSLFPGTYVTVQFSKINYVSKETEMLHKQLRFLVPCCHFY